MALGLSTSLARPTSSSESSGSSLARRLDKAGTDQPRFVQLKRNRPDSIRVRSMARNIARTPKEYERKGERKDEESDTEDEIESDDESDSEDERANEVDIAGTLDTPIALKGGNIKQDVTFPAATGKFEVEFQAKTARTLTVKENKTPAAAPAGFKLLEPSSFIVNLAEGGNALTLGQIDFIFDITSAALKGVDLKTSRVGKLNAETNVFTVDDSLGEVEFEIDENETVLKVRDLSGEFGIFVPEAAKGGDDAEAGQGGGAAKEEDEKAGQIEVTGLFGSVNNVEANVFTNLNFAANAAGSLEVEYNGTSPTTIRVGPALASAPPPAGHIYVDPLTFTISSSAAVQPGDTLKVDYIFTEGLKASIDPSKAVVGKFDAATQQFVTTGLGEFEFEEDENEWSLTVTDLNGQWAYFIPETAVL
ncbi:hypothetical protein F5B22DRAFT_640749 [Xylaria bambusicola]|uniref:uncharacterized protein n=1 Tax=Xylaria bambusicola TaxID=326684 RepID=UPI002008D10B|nr:uncharacterized protein F5B22DRAFT_640749 [Xylaria bambusicola]KAI0527769.1 hypothetical protein F5B22DRAFT_640749 [Xylaria bambusicola]